MKADARIAPVIQLLEASSDPAVLLDDDLRILYCNRAYEIASGREVSAGEHCYRAMPLEICADACLGCGAREQGRALAREDVSTMDGIWERRPYSVAAIPIGGGLVIETYRDGRGRSASTDLERLVHQEKMSSLGRLVAGIAHELNNPINFVYGNVDFLRQYVEDLLLLVGEMDESGELPPRLRERLDELKGKIEYDYLVEDVRRLIRSIRSGAERTASIVRDLKSFSHGGGGELQEMDLIAGIETTLNLISPLHKDRIRIERSYAPNLPKLWCHAGRINQVLMNLLTNAAQAIDAEGTIWISVDTEEGDDKVRIEVSDDGAGISADVLEKITDPFFTTKEVGVGTGLGLSISESIVRSHGGALTYESAEGEGSTFTVVLPVSPPAAERS